MKLAVLDDYHGVAARYGDFASLPGVATEVHRDHLDDLDALVLRLKDCEIVCLMRERTAFPRALIQRLPKLRLLVTTGPQNRSIDTAAATEHGILVCGTRVAPLRTAELTWALILALARHIPEEHANVRAGRWMTTIGQDVYGRRLGIVGLGRLGTRVGLIGRAFGMEVVAWSRNLTPESAEERNARYVPKDELFATSDVVTIHMVLSERSRHLVGADEIGRMKPTAFLINTSRGPLVDEAALVAALEAGRIAGAGLDVYDA